MAVSLLALVISLGGAGVAATGGNFILGRSNAATTTTVLTGNVAAGQALRLNNSNAAAGSTALLLATASTRPPMAVNSRVRIANLNADLLDGLEAASFASSSSEKWRYIGDPGEPSFQNGWINYGTGTHISSAWQHASYRRDQNGLVHLGGLVRNGAGTIFRLPASYCPFYNHPYPVLATDTLGRITVTFISGDGCNVDLTFGSNGWVSLDGISFQTAAIDH